MPGVEWLARGRRSGIGRLVQRTDIAALAAVFTFAALLSAFAMTARPSAISRPTTTPTPGRQLVSRARKHVDHGRPRFEASHERREQLANSFVAALRGGDLQVLEELLAHDVVVHADGGGRVRAITRPVYGRGRVARLLLKVMRAAEPFGGWSLRQVQVNGQPGVMRSDAAGKLSEVLVLDIDVDGHISAVRAIINPDKLRHLGEETS